MSQICNVNNPFNSVLCLLEDTVLQPWIYQQYSYFTFFKHVPAHSAPFNTSMENRPCFYMLYLISSVMRSQQTFILFASLYARSRVVFIPFSSVHCKCLSSYRSMSTIEIIFTNLSDIPLHMMDCIHIIWNANMCPLIVTEDQIIKCFYTLSC